jgi:hypothetical protein
VIEIPLRPEWHARAACHGLTDLFFPTRGEATDLPRSICESCPVQPECLEFSLANKERVGIWGGVTERQRRRMRRQARQSKEVRGEQCA